MLNSKLCTLFKFTHYSYEKKKIVKKIILTNYLILKIAETSRQDIWIYICHKNDSNILPRKLFGESYP